MEANQQTNSNNDASDPVNNSDSSNSSNPAQPVNADSTLKSNDEKKDNGSKCSNHHPIVINVPSEKNEEMLNEAKRANRFTRIGIFINTALFIITLLTFYQTKRSVDYTEATIKSSKWKDSVSLNLARIETRPVVQISGIEFSKDNKMLEYQIINIGRLPAKILTGRTNLIMTNSVYKKEEIEKMKTREEVSYNSAVFGIAIMKLSYGEIVIPDTLLALFKKGGLFFYFFGEFTYQSYVTNEKFKMTFIYQIQPIPALNVIAIKNEDTTLAVSKNIDNSHP